MALVITSAPSDELLPVEDAKRHLRVYSSDLDDEVASLVQASRDYCERFTQRTLRATVTRTLKDCKWWCLDLRLPWPPLIAVSSVTYYDTSNVSQTLSSSNYHVETSSDGSGRLVWATSPTIPSLYDRPDAITVTFTTGYTTIEASSANPLPPVALQAMKTKLEELWGAGTEGQTKAAKEATDRLLGLVDWTGYA
jgi:uncharacterized phiE125 gp8 family phage protein